MTQSNNFTFSTAPPGLTLLGLTSLQE